MSFRKVLYYCDLVGKFMVFFNAIVFCLYSVALAYTYGAGIISRTSAQGNESIWMRLLSSDRFAYPLIFIVNVWMCVNFRIRSSFGRSESNPEPRKLFLQGNIITLVALELLNMRANWSRDPLELGVVRTGMFLQIMLMLMVYYECGSQVKAVVAPDAAVAAPDAAVAAPDAAVAAPDAAVAAPDAAAAAPVDNTDQNPPRRVESLSSIIIKHNLT